MWLASIVAIWLSFVHVIDAKAVFAHFMVQNAESFLIPQWEAQIQLAKDAHIDGFALNIVYPWNPLMTQLSYAFTAANNKGFKMIFSFDYAASDAELGWPKDKVIELLDIYGPNWAYFKHSTGQPLVSTFEGPGWYADWHEIKQRTNAFFVPSYSSLGARPAMTTGVVDGLFNWGAWTGGAKNMNTEVDSSYKEFLNGKVYMMPVSPWFYTNMPGFTKNWLWRGDSMWSDRWNHVWFRQPEYVQIISWNDYGESHYIGPLDESQYEAFGPNRGASPFNYVRGMPHDAWRLLLPFAIDTYKNGVATITQELVVGWYRLTPGRTCATGGTTGNTASQLQVEVHPAEIIQDSIFFSALLGSNADVTVTIGGNASPAASWTRKPKDGVGIYQGSASFGGRTGQVVITITRSGATIARMTGQAITTACTNPNGVANYNAWVGSAHGPGISASPAPLSRQNCTEGFGVGGYNGLCQYACKYGYCPEVCTCSAMGSLLKTPTPKNRDGFPKPGELCGFKGLCSFGCNYDMCPSEHCTVDPSAKDKCSMPPEAPLPPLPTPGNGSPTGDDGCRKGTGPGNLEGLCDFSCWYGFCPSPCTCLSREGPAHARPAVPRKSGFALKGMTMDYANLCNFTVWHGYLANAACTEDLSQAADMYTAMPSMSGAPLPAGRMQASTESDDGMTLYVREDDNVGRLNQWNEMSGAWLKDVWCSPECQWCVHPDQFWRAQEPWMCMGALNVNEYCSFLYNDSTRVEKWQSINGRWASINIIGKWWSASSANPDDLEALKGSFRGNFLKTITAMWGGRNEQWKGPNVHGDTWSCGDVHTKQDCGMTFTEIVDKCEVIIIPGFALYMVQMQNVNLYYNDMWQAMGEAKIDLYAKAQELMDTFQKDEDSIADIFKAIAGAIGIIGIVGLAGAMSSGLATIGSVAGAVGGALGGGLSVYEALGTNELEEKVENAADLQKKASEIVNHLRLMVELTLKDLFSGSFRGYQGLNLHVQDGLFLDPVGNVSKFIHPIEEAVLAQLIPHVWRSAEGVRPVIALIRGEPRELPEDVSFDDANEYRTLFDNGNEKWAGFLFDLSECPTGELSSCGDRFKGLEGYTELERIGGIKAEDIVRSSFDAWKMRVDEPSWQLNYSYFRSHPLAFQGGARTPDVFNIPTCEWQVMRDNIWKHEGPDKESADPPCENYPCC